MQTGGIYSLRMNPNIDILPHFVML